jgi:hypothetical protein
VKRRGHDLIGENIPELPQETTDNQVREDGRFSAKTWKGEVMT